jgi:rubrerythrin
MGKPIRTLFVRIVLEKAIIFEERSYRYYESVLQQSIMKDTFDLIKLLLGQELHHRILLEEMQRRTTVEGKAFESRKQLAAEEFPFRELDVMCEEWPVISPGDSKEEILKSALHKERCACRFYQKMMEHARSDDLTRLFETLMHEEIQHARSIEEELEKISS